MVRRQGSGKELFLSGRYDYYKITHDLPNVSSAISHKSAICHCNKLKSVIAIAKSHKSIVAIAIN